jgi:hypothetical protein
MDKTAICNYALAKLGDEPILGLTDDSKRAKLMNRIYDQVRDAELRRHRWKFSILRAQIMALVAAPDWGYAYQYPLPSDFLQLIQVNDIYLRPLTKATPPWSVEGGKILTNLTAPLKIRYVAQVVNAGLYDPLFVEILACKLAIEGCETLTQSDTKASRAADQYAFSLKEAKRQDAIENPPDELPWGSWLASREGDIYLGGGVAGNVTDFASGVTVI